VIVMAKHIREQPASLRDAAPMRTFPKTLQRVLDKVLSKAPSLRFQTADEFEHALERCLRYVELLDRVPARGRRMMLSALSAPVWTRATIGAAALAVAAAAILALGQPRNVETQHATAKQMGAAPGPRPKAPTQTRPSVAVAHSEPPTQMVTLYSEPSGANVWDHGRFVGTTPLAVDVEDGRSLRVRVTMAGFEAQTLDLAPGEGSRVAKLTRAPAPAENTTLTERDRSRPAPKPRRTANAEKPAEPETVREPYEKF
jgi:hypothetical protein